MTAPRIEYGAQIASVAHPVYMKAFDRAVVDAWMGEYGTVTPEQAEKLNPNPYRAAVAAATGGGDQ